MKIIRIIVIILIIIGIISISIITNKAIKIKKVNDKKEIILEQFKEIASKNSYYLASLTNDQTPEYIKINYAAISKDQTYNIQMYESDTENNALEKIYMKEKESISKEKGVKTLKNINIKKYNLYEAEINKEKYILIRNGKTIISTKFEKTKEKDVLKFIKSINYLI